MNANAPLEMMVVCPLINGEVTNIPSLKPLYVVPLYIMRGQRAPGETAVFLNVFSA